MSDAYFFNNTIEQREHVLKILGYSYVIPEHLQDCVAVGIRYLSTKDYSDETISRMVQKPLSLSESLVCLGSTREGDISLFRGKLLEWLICMEYNGLKNKGNLVMTIVNPDPSSKADLLHIIDTGNSYKCVAGPDVKSGNAYYVFEQWEKILEHRPEIPMIDADGLFADEDELQRLYPRLWQRYQALKEKYPGKRPLPTTWHTQDVMRVTMDYIMYIGDGIVPGDIREGRLKESYTNKENCDRIKAKIREEAKGQRSVRYWEEFGVQVRDIPEFSQVETATSDQKTVEYGKIHSEAKDVQKLVRQVEETSSKSGFGILDRMHMARQGLQEIAIKWGYPSFRGMAWHWTKVVGIEILPILLPYAVSGIAGRIGKFRSLNPQKSAPSLKVVSEVATEVAKRTAPERHTVSGHSRMHNGKPIYVRPYERGGKGVG